MDTGVLHKCKGVGVKVWYWQALGIFALVAIIWILTSPYLHSRSMTCEVLGKWEKTEWATTEGVLHYRLDTDCGSLRVENEVLFSAIEPGQIYDMTVRGLWPMSPVVSKIETLP